MSKQKQNQLRDLGSDPNRLIRWPADVQAMTGTRALVYELAADDLQIKQFGRYRWCRLGDVWTAIWKAARVVESADPGNLPRRDQAT